MPKIKVLEETTVNQIAAGQVVEGASSVVKELVENAIDAGARRISVEIKAGGFQEICVVDDGCGMEREDAVLAFERHATSKIFSVDDLQTLGTMGFRGEALASIAAVAKVTLMTAVKEGTVVEVEGGKVVKVAPSARTQGTTVEVRSLFFNIPARKKFQKSVAASSAEIYRVMTLLALSHPAIAFELVGLFSVQAGSLKERIQAVLGSEFSISALKIEKEGVHGFVGSPKNTRPNRMGQYLFINRRAVTSPMVSFAVKEGFGTQIDERRHPIFVLHLEMAPHLVDVNVHPQKKEVRFQDEAEVRRVVKEAIEVAFFGERPTFSAPASVTAFMPALKFREEPFATAPSFLDEPPEPPEPIGLWDHFLLLDAKVAEGYAEGILAVDLWAAQERVIYEEVKEKGASQRLLLPVTIELLPGETALINLERLGFSLRQMGKGVWIVEAIPPFLEEGEVVDVIRSLSGEEAYEKMARKISKRVKKKPFVLQEALALWQKLYRLPNWNGSATYLSRTTIEKSKG